MNFNIEQKRYEFKQMKASVERKFKGSKISIASNGQYYVSQNNINIIDSEWEGLRLADTVYNAWKNAYICEHWDNQAMKRINTVKNTIVNICGDTTSLPIVEPYEYAEPNLELPDEEAFNQ